MKTDLTTAISPSPSRADQPPWNHAPHLAFFGLSEEPFLLTPNRRFFFRSAGHNAILRVVRYGIRQGEGFIIITGEVGTGKTLLLRMLLAEFRAEFKDEYETALILSPLLSPAELLQAILVDVGRETAAASDNMESLLRELNGYLFALASDNRRLAVIIDEAQNLPDETIEQLRLLSNFESDRQKWLQIILVGQPELRHKLRQPNLRQLLQRITIIETLPALTPEETVSYVNFRLARAGRDNLVMGRRARQRLWRLTNGVPRRINRLAARALLVAFSRHSPRLTASIFSQADASLALDQKGTPRFNRSRRGLLLAGAVSLALIACILSLRPDFAERVIRDLANLVAIRP
ncbi:MAG: AAA family ATPase [Desulfobacterales bacterium]|nr:AAA family ATPase [Desulfobacterales bacterium]